MVDMHVNEYTPGQEKEHVRKHVFLFFMKCSYVLTLPNIYFDLEKMLIQEGKKVECCEYKHSIYQKQLKIAPKEIVLHHSDVKDLDIGKYDALFLDFCGTYNRSTSKILSKISSNTQVAITFLLRRERKEHQSVIDINNRIPSYIRLLATFGIKVTKYITYHKDYHSPMCVFFGTKY